MPLASAEYRLYMNSVVYCSWHFSFLSTRPL
uniref:Uncharacterized protein n=1 Tax=Anguilla anguilla TaxID=7936 RepID=A0A0E9R387_ANGAN